MGEEKATSKKEKKPIFKKVWFWVLVVIVVLAVGAQVGFDKKEATKVSDGAESSQNDDDKTSQDGSNEETDFKVGDVIAFDGKQVTVSAVQRNYSTGNEYIKPDDGKELIKVDISIENKSDEKVSYNTFDWKIEDGGGAIESQSGNAIMAQADDDLGSGDLAKDGKKSGSIVFEVPAGDTNLKLHYQPSFWSDKEVIIKL